VDDLVGVPLNFDAFRDKAGVGSRNRKPT